MHQVPFFCPYAFFSLFILNFSQSLFYIFSFSPPFPVLYYDKVIPHSESCGGIAIKVKLSLPSL